MHKHGLFKYQKSLGNATEFVNICKNVELSVIFWANLIGQKAPMLL